jgi:predicted Zn-dependent protease
VDLSDTFLTTLRDLERRRTSSPDQALRTLEDALRQTRVPAERCELLIRKARWLLAEDRAADALQPLKGAFIYQPANPELRYLMARASHALDQLTEAIRHARAANAYVHLLSDEAGRWIRELLEE